MELSRIIGSRIIELRNEKRLSQEDLCNAAGISRKAMHNIECGKCYVRINTLYKIINTLGVSINEFFAPFGSDYEITN
ncbi:MAG: helix-turn-helix domain-containing protein [Acholeplasmatales bacterium]|nr:helix-turn-helix domain-containing protein [Acholeplasmatales bacterium]